MRLDRVPGPECPLPLTASCGLWEAECLRVAMSSPGPSSPQGLPFILGGVWIKVQREAPAPHPRPSLPSLGCIHNSKGLEQKHQPSRPSWIYIGPLRWPSLDHTSGLGVLTSVAGLSWEDGPQMGLGKRPFTPQKQDPGFLNVANRDTSSWWACALGL